MVWPAIPTAFALVAIAFIIGDYVDDNPKILENVADAVLMYCSIDDLLYEKMVDAGLSQDHILILDAMRQGKEVSARDVRDLGGHVKHVVGAAKWGTICALAYR